MIKTAVLLLTSAWCIPQSLAQSQPSRQQQIQAHNRKAAEYLKQNQPQLAAAELKQVISLDPGNVDAHGNLGAILFFHNDYAGSIPELRAAVKGRPALWKTRALLGIAEKRAGNLEAARQDLEASFQRIEEKNIRRETGMELIEIYSSDGELDKAPTILSALRALDPTDEAVLYTSYRLYSDLAAESLLSLSVVNPNSARMHQAMAHELAKRGDTAGAIENYRASLKLDPNLAGLHFELAEMLGTLSTDEGRQEAEKEYKIALQQNPGDEQAECRLGDIDLQRDDLNEARARYTHALQLQPRDPEASIGLAKVYMSTDQPAKAEELLQRALELDPTSALAHYRLSTVYRQTGRTEDARRELEQYEKYTKMKDQLREVYRDLHQQHEIEETGAASEKK